MHNMRTALLPQSDDVKALIEIEVELRKKIKQLKEIVLFIFLQQQIDF